MPVRLIVTFTAAPGKGEELAAAWRPRLKEVHEEPGCEQYEIFRSIERPDTLVLLERWSSPELLEKHLELNRQRGAATPPELQAGRPSMERFEV